LLILLTVLFSFFQKEKKYSVLLSFLLHKVKERVTTFFVKKKNGLSVHYHTHKKAMHDKMYLTRREIEQEEVGHPLVNHI